MIVVTDLEHNLNFLLMRFDVTACATHFPNFSASTRRQLVVGGGPRTLSFMGHV